jgi:hypothetical protein
LKSGDVNEDKRKVKRMKREGDWKGEKVERRWIQRTERW